MTPRNAYLATVTDLFGTARYREGKARAVLEWPDASWIEPAEMRWSLDQWRAAWVDILPCLDLLAVIPRDDLTIGRGCFQEILDCTARGIPTFVLMNGRWCRRFHVERMPGVSYRYWAKVVKDGV